MPAAKAQAVSVAKRSLRMAERLLRREVRNLKLAEVLRLMLLSPGWSYSSNGDLGGVSG